MLTEKQTTILTDVIGKLGLEFTDENLAMTEMKIKHDYHQKLTKKSVFQETTEKILAELIGEKNVESFMENGTTTGLDRKTRQRA